VSIVTILAIAIPATGILMMRFRKRWLAKFNIFVTNELLAYLPAGYLGSAFSLT
jgi:hypothetical protein